MSRAQPAILVLADGSVFRGLSIGAAVTHREIERSAVVARRLPGLALLERVSRRQAMLVAQWMNVGFIHGVMNTDNMTISGETIDYGPCAFMEAYDPQAVFSSIDRNGRYAYGNQPLIAQWNLARLAEALLPLVVADGGDELAGDRLRPVAARHRLAQQKCQCVQVERALPDQAQAGRGLRLIKIFAQGCQDDPGRALLDRLGAGELFQDRPEVSCPGPFEDE